MRYSRRSIDPVFLFLIFLILLAVTMVILIMYRVIT
jgi:hypothetical protein